MTLNIPATDLSPAATVELTPQQPDAASFEVRHDGRLIGYVWKGSSSFTVGTGRVVVRHGETVEWQAVHVADASKTGHALAAATFNPDRYPARYRRNSRKGAVAFLLACEAGATSPAYFNWQR